MLLIICSVLLCDILIDLICVQDNLQILPIWVVLNLNIDDLLTLARCMILLSHSIFKYDGIILRLHDVELEYVNAFRLHHHINVAVIAS